MHGSWRPVTAIFSGTIVCKLTLCCSRAMDGVGLNAARNTMGMPFVIPPRMPPQWFVSVMILPFSTVKASIILAAAKARHAKARAELDALDRGNAENSRGDAIFHAAKHRVAKARGRAENCAFDDAANAVTSLARRRDGFGASPRRAHR